VRVASRYYKGPELLVDDTKYHYSLDVWSAGCSMAEIIFKQDPFFFGDDNNDQLIKVAKVLGTDDLLEYMRKYNLTLNTYFQQKLDRYQKKELKTFINSENKHLVNEEALDLLSKMLVYDKNLRITPKEALDHPYFEVLRGEANDVGE
jgi:casein kinase II subunit alpha